MSTWIRSHLGLILAAVVALVVVATSSATAAIMITGIGCDGVDG